MRTKPEPENIAANIARADERVASSVGEPTPQQPTQGVCRFGLIKPPEPAEPEQKPWLPPELRRGTFVSNMPYAEALAKYGAHKIRIVRGTSIYGQSVNPGDEADVPGNVAYELIIGGHAESLDPRREHEGRLFAEARSLRIPLSDAENPAFQPPPAPPQPRRRSFIMQRSDD